jgi:hypothetical protein
MYDQLRALLDGRPPVAGVTIADVMGLPAPLSTTLNRMIRRGGLSAADLADALGVTAAEAQQIGELLVEHGYCAPSAVRGGAGYQARLARKPGRALPESFLKAIDELPKSS